MSSSGASDKQYTANVLKSSIIILMIYESKVFPILFFWKLCWKNWELARLWKNATHYLFVEGVNFNFNSNLVNIKFVLNGFTYKLTK